MPRGLPKAVKKSLEKSRDAALLAIENYNKPAIKFRSGGYIVLMTIAYTALFHAIFFKRKIKPFHRKENSNRFKRRDGDFEYWELKTCLKEYYKTDTANPIRKNIEFFIPLRNKIEHKSLPEIDTNIFGECQALLLNFDSLLESEFGEEYCLKESLSFSLQLFPSKNNLDKSLEVSSDAEEQNLLQTGISNLITTTSDMFTVYMRIRTFKRNPVDGSWNATDLDYIIDDSRYVMLVDRSNVNSPSDKPKILYFEKLPN